MDMQGMMNTSMMVLTKPSKSSFASAKESVNTTNTLIGLVVAGAISGLIAGFRSGGAVSGLIGGVIGTLIGFYVFSAIMWVVAKILGGKGDFMLQGNLLATFYVPLLVVNAILGLIPVVGAIIAFLVFLFMLYLTTLALEAVHSYSIMKAVVTWLVPLIIFGILFLVVGAAMLALLGIAASQ